MSGRARIQTQVCATQKPVVVTTSLYLGPEYRKHFQPRQAPFHKVLDVIEILRLEGCFPAVCAHKGCKEKVADGQKTDPQ